MKRSFVCAVLAVLLLTLALPPRPGAAVQAVPVLEVTGVFEGFDSDKDGEFINLNVNGRTFSGTLSPMCRFQDDRGQALEKKNFLQRYEKRYVVVEILEDSKEVVSCAVK